MFDLTGQSWCEAPLLFLRGGLVDSSGCVLVRHVLRYGGPCPGIQVPRVVCHSCRCWEPGSVVFEAKDRPYDPERTEDLLGE